MGWWWQRIQWWRWWSWRIRRWPRRIWWRRSTRLLLKHLSIFPLLLLFSKTIFGNVMYVLYLYLYSNPYSDVELLLHQPKSATLHTFSLKKCFINLFQKTFLRQTLFDDKLFCIRQSNQKKNVIISSERKSLKFN